MADPKPKTSSIPDWQRQNSALSTSPDSQDAASRTALLEQASKFLEDESIRDAPTDRKITFLESKGFKGPEIESLLGVSRNPEASSTAEESKTDAPTPEAAKQQPSSTSTNIESESTSSSPSSSAPTPSTLSNIKSPSAPPRDVAPIITYPEFLLHQSKPPPLVTLQSVLYTLYGAAGLGASIYAASEYIVKPMLSNLTSARQELADTTTANLRKLNEKLEQNVSRIPPQFVIPKPTDETPDSDSGDEVESVTSDPTELFHRDIGTQTSEYVSQDQQQLWSSSSAQAGETGSGEGIIPDPTATVTTHQKRLESIGSHLREFADAQNQSGTLEDTTRSRINDLQHFLDGLIYSKNTYASTTGYGVYSSGGYDSGNGASSGVAKGEEDAIAGFRSEIRGVKGALLSARNFPSSRGARIGGGSFSR